MHGENDSRKEYYKKNNDDRLYPHEDHLLGNNRKMKWFFLEGAHKSPIECFNAKRGKTRKYADPIHYGATDILKKSHHMYGNSRLASAGFNDFYGFE